MKKFNIVCFVFILLCGMFSGCAGSKTQDTQSSAGDTPQIKIGMLLDNTVTDGGWNQALAESMERTKQELGLEGQVIILENIKEASAEADASIMQLIEEGCNLIISPSAGCKVNVEAFYSKYPDVCFAQFEGGSAENYCSFTIWDVEAIFMCGYAAALMSEEDTLGFVAAQPQASVIRTVNAWAAGAKAANPNAKVQVIWVNSWYDPAAEKECANSLLSQGIQVIGQHGSTVAVAEACQEAGAYCTCHHIDRKDAAPESVLTSFCWNWSPVFEQLIQNVENGTFDGEIVYKGMKEGAADIAPWNTEIMPQEVIDQCDAMYQEIVNGEYAVMEGPLYDNLGNQVLEAGAQFSLEEMVSMYFLLDNVIGELP